MLVMDASHWDLHQLQPSSLRKRPWDVDSTSRQASAVGSRHGNQTEGHYPLGESDWKRRRNTPQANTSPWEASVQTSLWLAQQNNMSTTASVDREDIDHPRRTIGFQQICPRDEPLNSTSSWPRHSEGVDRPQGQEEQGSYRQPLVSDSSYKLSGPPHHLTNAALPPKVMQETAAPQPRRPPNIASIEPGIEPPPCGKCLHSEPLLREAAFNLQKLSEALVSGPLSEIINQSRKDGLVHDQIPQLVKLHRVLDVIEEASSLSKQVIQAVPTYLQDVKKEEIQATDNHSDLETMKRRFLADTQEVLEKQQRRSSDVHSNLLVQNYSSMLPDPATLSGSSRRASIAGVANNELLPPIRSQSPPHLTSDAYGPRLPSMKPPPTPGRQLPSPPGRSQPSPPSYNIPSPSSLFYPQSVTSTGAPASTALPNILHPLSPTPSSSLGASTAIQAHTAALQHEVSVKKYALQTLQSEHDKLLAAFRRSQTRARALEEKQVASDLEINTLAEERVRLLTQVQDLEQNITDISKSREEFRQAAVKGGAQYVKIVRMASQLEMMAGEERREWKRKIEEHKATIDALREAQDNQNAPAEPAIAIVTSPDDSCAPSVGLAEDLKKEIQRLRTRQSEMELMLETIRNEKRRFDEAVTALGTAGERIFRSTEGSAASDLKARPSSFTPNIPTTISQDA